MIQLTDNSPAVLRAMEAAVLAFLHEAGGELTAQTAKNARVDTGQTKNAYHYRVVPGAGEQKAVIGSDYPNAVWEEYGTGEYALGGNGRKGGWWIRVGNGAGEISPKAAKRYHWAGYRYENGEITFVFTRGKKPNAPLRRAYDTLRPSITDEMTARHFQREMR